METDNFNVPDGLTAVKPIREIIYDHLRQAILDGVLKPGDRLIERDIAAKYAVSRTPVREALRKLESEGYLDYLPRKGEVVRGFNVDEIQEMYDIRKALECLIIRRAIQNITRQEILALKGIVRQLEQEAETRQAHATFKGLHDFDELILRTARMPLAAEFIHTLQETLTRYRRINLSHAPQRKEAVQEHKEILQAIIAQDVHRAEQAIISHIDNSCNALLQGIRQNG